VKSRVDFINITGFRGLLGSFSQGCLRSLGVVRCMNFAASGMIVMLEHI